MWSDSLTTIKQAPAVFITCPTYPDYFVPAIHRNTFNRACVGAFCSVGVLIESHHYTMEGNGCGCILKLFGYQAAPEVCLLGAGGQLLQLPASGSGRIEYFLLQDV